MTPAPRPSTYAVSRPTEASHLRSAEQAVAYLVAYALRDGGSIPLAVEDRLRVLCVELDAASGGAL